MKTGKLIIFEGTDGAGKSTQLRLLANHLEANNYEIVTTFEPTNGPYGQKIRSLYTNRHATNKNEELELFIADRKEHVENLLKPSLSAGKIILCDRYFLSTAAYQGALGFDPNDILELNSFAPRPDIVLLFQLPVQQGRARIEKLRGEETNDFEKEEMLIKVAQIFDALDLPYIHRIDASLPVEDVHKNIVEQITHLLY